MEPLSGKLDPSEIDRARRMNRNAIPGVRLLTVIFLVMPVMSFIALLMVIVVGGPWDTALTLFGPAILVSGGFYWIFSRGIPGVFEKRGPAANGQLAPFELRINDEGLSIHNQYGIADWLGSRYSRLLRTSN